MTNNSNRSVVPEAREALNKFKYEVASDMCVKNIFKHYLLATLFLFMLFSFLFLSFHLIH
ncbi:MAG: small, acid-soluble spore protein, alpha/beta type [Clostridia bacterium]|jgi:hypothetical protein|nr:small, acid-soluble spore protein, alpha/beta type [Clostridia bacterium]